MKPLYVELDDADRARVERLAAVAGMAAGRPVGLAEVVRQLIRDATNRNKPVRVEGRG